MPRNRADVDRETKVDAILDCAQQQLTTGGFEALSLGAIARQLGVAQNTVYWYFPSKDELLVATLRRMIGRVADRRPPQGADLVAQAIWLFDRLEEATPLRVAVHGRLSGSPVVAEFQREFRQTLRTTVAAWLAPAVPAAELDLATELLMATADGLLLEGVPRATRNRLLRYGLAKLTA